MKARQPNPEAKGRLRERPPLSLIVLSFVLALLYWGYTVSEEKSLKDVSVPLEFTNVPKDKIIVGENLPRLVTVEIKGSPEMLRRVREEDVDAKVDVGKLKLGPQVLEIGQEDIRLPSSVSFVRVLPGVLHFTLERKVTETLPLDPHFTGHVTRGNQVLGWSIEPPSTRIEGPESIVRRMRHAPTQPVSLEGRSQDFQAPVVPTFSDPEISVLDLGPYTLNVRIGERRSQRTIGPIPIKVLNAKYPVVLDPTTLKVMVDGPFSLVHSLTPQDLVAEVDVTGLKPSNQAYQLRPAVRFSSTNLAAHIEITSWIQRFVGVKVLKPGQTVEPSLAPVPAGGNAP